MAKLSGLLDGLVRGNSLIYYGGADGEGNLFFEAASLVDGARGAGGKMTRADSQRLNGCWRFAVGDLSDGG